MQASFLILSEICPHSRSSSNLCMPNNSTWQLTDVTHFSLCEERAERILWDQFQLPKITTEKHVQPTKQCVAFHAWCSEILSNLSMSLAFINDTASTTRTSVCHFGSQHRPWFPNWACDPKWFSTLASAGIGWLVADGPKCWRKETCLFDETVQLTRNYNSVVVAAVAAACSGSWSGNFKDTIVVDAHIFQQDGTAKSFAQNKKCWWNDKAFPSHSTGGLQESSNVQQILDFNRNLTFWQMFFATQSTIDGSRRSMTGQHVWSVAKVSMLLLISNFVMLMHKEWHQSFFQGRKGWESQAHQMIWINSISFMGVQWHIWDTACQGNEHFGLERMHWVWEEIFWGAKQPFQPQNQTHHMANTRQSSRNQMKHPLCLNFQTKREQCLLLNSSNTDDWMHAKGKGDKRKLSMCHLDTPPEKLHLCSKRQNNHANEHQLTDLQQVVGFVGRSLLECWQKLFHFCAFAALHVRHLMDTHSLHWCFWWFCLLRWFFHRSLTHQCKEWSFPVWHQMDTHCTCWSLLWLRVSGRLFCHWLTQPFCC